MAASLWRKQIEIGGQTWAVKLVPSKQLPVDKSDGQKVLGRCYFMSRTILILKDLDEEMRWKVLLHEIIHAALFSANHSEVTLDLGYFEEPLVERLERFLYPVLNKNYGFGHKGKVT
jgi:hypothetical protein